MTLNTRSLQNMAGIHPDLKRIVIEADRITPQPFTVICGLRTLAEQKRLVASGASDTMNSRHLTGHAVDVVPTVQGKIRWDWPLYYKLAPAWKQAARNLSLPIEWGGDWEKPDGPHFQLPWKAYPLK